MTDIHDDPCAHCEEMMQPYLDHILSDEEMREAEMHLDECDGAAGAIASRRACGATSGKRRTSRCRPTSS